MHYFISYMNTLCPEYTLKHNEDNNRSLMSPMLPRTPFSNLVLWRHRKVTWYKESIDVDTMTVVDDFFSLYVFLDAIEVILYDIGEIDVNKSQWNTTTDGLWHNIYWELLCMKHVSRACINNYITQYSMACNNLSLPSILDSGPEVQIWWRDIVIIIYFEATYFPSAFTRMYKLAVKWSSLLPCG